MATLFSTALKNYLAVTGAAHAALNACEIGIFSGPVPSTADAATTGATLLCTISVGGAGTGGTFAATATNGVLTKTATENWQGTVAATGTASFWRLYIPGVASDNGQTADTTAANCRVQGTCGTDVTADMVLPSVSLTSGNTQAINQFQILMAQG